MQPYDRGPRHMRRGKLGRSQDGIRQTYYDGDLRAAREAAERAAEDDNQKTGDNHGPTAD